MSKFQFGIIIPSYQDHRILKTIKSILDIDKTSKTKIYIIDGGSTEILQNNIKKALREHDYFITEKDRGIFDALNKGLNKVEEEYIGWLGSDDIYADDFSFEELEKLFSTNIDAVVYDTNFVSSGKVRRVSRARNLRMIRLGFHNPHFSTFMRKSSVGHMRFDLKYKNLADIFFFIKFFAAPSIKIVSIRKVACIMSLGGVSNRHNIQIIKNNLKIFKILLNEKGFVFAFSFTFNKLLSKFI